MQLLFNLLDIKMTYIINWLATSKNTIRFASLQLQWICIILNMHHYSFEFEAI